MNADLQNKWSEIVRINHDVPAIQAADAEMKRLRKRDAEAVKLLMAIVGNGLLNEPIFDKLLVRAQGFYDDAALKSADAPKEG